MAAVGMPVRNRTSCCCCSFCSPLVHSSDARTPVHQDALMRARHRNRYPQSPQIRPPSSPGPSLLHLLASWSYSWLPRLGRRPLLGHSVVQRRQTDCSVRRLLLLYPFAPSLLHYPFMNLHHSHSSCWRRPRPHLPQSLGHLRPHRPCLTVRSFHNAKWRQHLSDCSASAQLRSWNRRPSLLAHL